jgi:hypothetical protein
MRSRLQTAFAPVVGPPMVSASRVSASAAEAATEVACTAPLQVPPKWRTTKAFAIGLLGGAMGSMVGVAGGVFMIPMTTAYLGYTQHQGRRLLLCPHRGVLLCPDNPHEWCLCAAISLTLPAIVSSSVVGTFSFARY